MGSTRAPRVIFGAPPQILKGGSAGDCQVSGGAPETTRGARVLPIRPGNGGQPGSRPRLRVQPGFQIVAGEAGGAGGDDFGGAFGEDLPAAGAAFRAHVDDPVGAFDDAEVMLECQLPRKLRRKMGERRSLSLRLREAGPAGEAGEEAVGMQGGRGDAF